MANTFTELGLSKPVLEAITELGFETPTPIQDKVIPVLLAGNCDMVALAQTGTGKTAAFGLPLITMTDFSEREPKVLILAPTRELCMQITSDLKNFSKHIKGANIVPVYGGASIRSQIDDLERGAQIIVATPGRMVDIIHRKRVDLSTIQYVVLDEADEMLNMGFKDDLDFILSAAPRERNTWLFSATMPDDVLRISRDYQHDPVEITAGTKNLANENIEHIYYVTNERERYKVLKRIADYYPEIFGLVFCRTKIETQKVADMLIKDGYNADALHGDLSQAQRDHVMKRFRNRTLQMLVATDVAARGIDVNDITHVIHYNLPDEIENYTHRSGRTARAGKKGISIAIINSRDVYKIKTLEKLTQKRFTKAQIPNGFEICEKQLFHLVQGVHDTVVNEEAISDYLPKVFLELKDLSKEEIIKRFVSVEFNRFLDYYKNAPDLNVSGDERGDRKEKEGFTRLFVSLGKMDGLENQSLKDYLVENSGIAADAFGWSDLKNSFSFIEVKNEFQDALLNAFKTVSFKGRPVRIESGGKERQSDSGERRGGARSGRDRERRGGGGRSDSRFEKGWGNDRGGKRNFKPRSDRGSDRGGSRGFSPDRGPRKEYSDRGPKKEYAPSFDRPKRDPDSYRGKPDFERPKRDPDSYRGSSDRSPKKEYTPDFDKPKREITFPKEFRPDSKDRSKGPTREYTAKLDTRGKGGFGKSRDSDSYRNGDKKRKKRF